jgi:hypothetical protein
MGGTTFANPSFSPPPPFTSTIAPTPFSYRQSETSSHDSNSNTYQQHHSVVFIMESSVLHHVLAASSLDDTPQNDHAECRTAPQQQHVEHSSQQKQRRSYNSYMSYQWLVLCLVLVYTSCVDGQLCQPCDKTPNGFAVRPGTQVGTKT